jgi:hypothetical protein
MKLIFWLLLWNYLRVCGWTVLIHENNGQESQSPSWSLGQEASGHEAGKLTLVSDIVFRNCSKISLMRLKLLGRRVSVHPEFPAGILMSRKHKHFSCTVTFRYERHYDFFILYIISFVYGITSDICITRTAPCER